MVDVAHTIQTARFRHQVCSRDLKINLWITFPHRVDNAICPGDGAGIERELTMKSGDKIWTLAMGGLRGIVLHVAGESVTVQLFDRPMHIRTVPMTTMWCFHRELNDDETWAACPLG